MTKKLLSSSSTCTTLLVFATAATTLIPCQLLAAEPVYLSQSWFHRGDDVNLMDTPAGQRLAVDNEGKYILDSSRFPRHPRIRMNFDSIQKIGGDYIMGTVGPYGRSTWAQVDLDVPETIYESVGKPLFSPGGFHFDADPVRGNPGLAVFPDDPEGGVTPGLVMICAQSPMDSRMFKLVASDDQGQLDIPIYRKAGGSVRASDFADRVFLDRDGKGFWYLGGRNGKLAIIHALPGIGANGTRTLNLSEIVDLGPDSELTFEAGISANRELWLMLAKEDASIGGVDAERTLLRITRDGGIEEKTSVTLTRRIPYSRLALLKDNVVVHDWNDLFALDRQTLKPQWRRTVAELAGNTKLDYHIYWAVGQPEGDRLAVGLATPYRKPGEATHALLLDPQGKLQESYVLQPGSVDDMVFTRDGGLLFFSSHYTAKLGGNGAVRHNELTSIQRSDNDAPEAPAESERTFAYPETPLDQRHKLWFVQPAKDYNGQSMLLGNGHLGAMITGGTEKERINLNVDSMWTGDENRMGAYQGFGQLQFMIGHSIKDVTGYRRELDLRTGIHTVTYTYKGTTYKREAFCSYPRGLLAIRFTADKPAAHTGQLELSSMHTAELATNRHGITFTGQLKNGRKFRGAMRIEAIGGKILPEAGKSGVREQKYRRYSAQMPYDSIKLEGCDSVTVYFAGDTDYSLDAGSKHVGAHPEEKIGPRLANIRSMSFDDMRDESAADVARLFDRCTFELATSNPDAEARPTDQRRSGYGGDSSDAGFEALIFDANRYMMIAASRPGSLPANLQGLWNFSNWPAWTSDYHTDINVQMNYWFVEPANLAECAEPLFDYIESQIPHWREDARAAFGPKTRGWTVRYMNNIDGGGAYKNYPAGNAWLAWHYAEHFKFSQDETFLRGRAYPLLKELSEHWEDLLIERPGGQLTTPRTMSPEHKPEQYGITQDVEMVDNLFADTLAAAKRLSVDLGFEQKVQDLQNRLIPIRIGRWGQIQEWEPDRDSRYCTHRHIQHLFAAFPGRQICPKETPELAAAAITSLEARGTGRSGWSKAWRMSIFARLQKPDLFYRQLRLTPRGFHDTLVWEGKQQVDAPCGYVSGVCEALLQSHRTLDQRDSQYLVHLLPALPKAWPTGRVKGLRARGGYEVDMEWTDGQLTEAVIRNVAAPKDTCTLQYGQKQQKIKIASGESRVLPVGIFQ